MTLAPGAPQTTIDCSGCAGDRATAVLDEATLLLLRRKQREEPPYSLKTCAPRSKTARPSPRRDAYNNGQPQPQPSKAPPGARAVALTWFDEERGDLAAT